MSTLKPSDFKSAQQIFDYIVSSVVAQGKPSLNKERQPRYRGLDGTKCAAGFLIPDDHPAIIALASWRKIVQIWTDLDSDYTHLIQNLQTAHDANRYHLPEEYIYHFINAANNIANNYQLKPFPLFSRREN